MSSHTGKTTIKIVLCRSCAENWGRQVAFAQRARPVLAGDSRQDLHESWPSLSMLQLLRFVIVQLTICMSAVRICRTQPQCNRFEGRTKLPNTPASWGLI
jgi:hypothetical protein